MNELNFSLVAFSLTQYAYFANVYLSEAKFLTKNKISVLRIQVDHGIEFLFSSSSSSLAHICLSHFPQKHSKLEVGQIKMTVVIDVVLIKQGIEVFFSRIFLLSFLYVDCARVYFTQSFPFMELFGLHFLQVKLISQIVAIRFETTEEIFTVYQNLRVYFVVALFHANCNLTT